MIANNPIAWDERAQEETPWKAGLWSERGQTQRFLAVLRHLTLQDGDHLLDFGCGTGRLCEFLPLAVTYYAYDWSQAMRQRVRRDYERAWVLDEVPNDVRFDHIVCIGTFNLFDQWSRAQTWDTLEQLLPLATKNLAVSLFSGEPSDSMLDYTLEHVRYFLDRLDRKRFVIDTSYLPNDLLLVLPK